jgi:outer membrane protein OmpA-like peptidoglycan-associated protein
VAVAAAVLVAGGGVAFMLSGDGVSEPNWHDVFDPTTVAKPSDGSLENSVTQVSTVGSVTARETRGKVQGLDSAGTVKPWVQSTLQSGATVVTISTDVLFDSGTADVGPVGQAVIVEAVMSAPDGASVSVTGYTDSRGNDEANLQRSLERAEAVATIIRSARPDVTVSPAGMGSTNQVAPNTNPDGSDNPEGRSQNRRVEIRYG